MKNLFGFGLAFIAGLFATIQGYQGVIGSGITGNVIGTSVSTGIGSLAVIFGMLILAGSFLMMVSETRKVGGLLTVVLGVLIAIVSLGSSLIPALVSIAAGLTGLLE